MFVYYFCLIPFYSFISHAYTLFARALSPLFYKLIGSLSDNPGFARSDIGVLLIWSGFVEIVHLARSWSLSTYSGVIAFLYSYYNSLIPVYQTYLLFHFLFHLRSCVDIICIIAVMLILHSDYIVCSDYFRLNVYMWVFSSRVYIADVDSRCYSVSTYFGKQSVTGFFLISEPVFDLRSFSFRKKI